MAKFSWITAIMLMGCCLLSCNFGGSTDTDNGREDPGPVYELNSIESGSVWDSAVVFVAGSDAGGTRIYSWEENADGGNTRPEIEKGNTTFTNDAGDTLTSVKNYSLDSGVIFAVFDVNGFPVPEFKFRLIDVNFDPSSQDLSDLNSEYKTDSLGVALVPYLPSVPVNLEGFRVSTVNDVLYLLPMELKSGQVQFQRLILQAVETEAMGKVNRASEFEFDSLGVFIRGSSQLRYTNSEGVFNFGPADIQINSIEFFISSSTKLLNEGTTSLEDSVETPYFDITTNCRVREASETGHVYEKVDSNEESNLGIWLWDDIDSTDCR